jgi:hypothetical protein
MQHFKHTIVGKKPMYIANPHWVANTRKTLSLRTFSFLTRYLVHLFRFLAIWVVGNYNQNKTSFLFTSNFGNQNVV